MTPPLQVLLRSHCVFHRWGHHLPSIRAQLCQDWSSGTWDNWLKLDLGGGSIVYKNWDKNGKKRLEIDKTILFHIHKHCTFSFTSKQPIFTSQQPILNSVWSLFCFKVANSKRKKRRSFFTGYKGAPQCFKRFLYLILQVYNPVL